MELFQVSCAMKYQFFEVRRKVMAKQDFVIDSLLIVSLVYKAFPHFRSRVENPQGFEVGQRRQTTTIILPFAIWSEGHVL